MTITKVISPPTVHLRGYEVKISENNYDRGVLVVVKNDKISYFTVKYFLGVESAREWYGNLGNNI